MSENLKRTPSDGDGACPCVGCGEFVSTVVSFKDGTRICEACAVKVIGIFKANRQIARQRARDRRALGVLEVKSGKLRGARLRKGNDA